MWGIIENGIFFVKRYRHQIYKKEKRLLKFFAGYAMFNLKLGETRLTITFYSCPKKNRRKQIDEKQKN